MEAQPRKAGRQLPPWQPLEVVRLDATSLHAGPLCLERKEGKKERERKKKERRRKRCTKRRRQREKPKKIKKIK